MTYQQKLKEEGNGIKDIQKWSSGQRLGYVPTREDEDGGLIVLWKEVENMFVNYVPKFATIDGHPIPFHFHKNLTENQEESRITQITGSKSMPVVIVLRGISGSSSSSKSKNEVSPAAIEAFKRNGNETCRCQQQQQNQPPTNEKPVGNVRACCTAHCCCRHQQQHNVSASGGN
ncbi:hypothetical protein KI688_011218 [Linnemannia hyalina]|uniref:Uncharacterized protein n=1 Tax=Linnemannia hyalina TaxID=64524 RepID=A0A9P8BXH8_9FUNG|nr:hypothetical protein KI688_011218 [Linnemannia hyalina]